MSFAIKSSTLKSNQPIPIQHTGDGENYSPEISWTGTPAGTREFALICDDPDAPGDRPFVHWVVYNIPPTTTSLRERMLDVKTIPGSTTHQGVNDFGRFGYGGPHPPPGPAHRYYFKLYALSAPVELEGGATAHQVEKEIRGNILEEVKLMGTYQRGGF